MQQKYTSRFIIYPKDIERFIEYCKRFEVLQHASINFIVEKNFFGDTDSFIWDGHFICDITLYNELDSIRFINIFNLFFTISKYCSMIQN